MIGIYIMTECDIDEVVRLHEVCFPNHFLTFLGKHFLKCYYKGILAYDKSLAFTIKNGKSQSIGFVTGVINPSNFYKNILKRDWFKYIFAAFLAMVKNPKIIPRLFRAVNKPKEAKVGNHIIELTSIAISPKEENKGYGQILLNHFCQEASLRGCEEIVLYTDAENNEKVNYFYKKLGFEISKLYTTKEGRKMYEYKRIINND